MFPNAVVGAGFARPYAIVYNGGFGLMGGFGGIMDGAGRPRPYNILGGLGTLGATIWDGSEN
jgi:hypothetical protein